MVARPHAGSLRYGDTVHTVGGGVHSYMSAHVESSLLQDFGAPSAAIASAPLPTVRNAPATVVIGRYGYVLGGNTCFYGGCYPTSVLMAALGGGDSTPPVLSLPDDVTAEALSAAGAPVAFAASASDDVDGDVPVVCSPESGSVFPLGATTVTCTTSDTAGNFAEGSFVITVLDTLPPTITSPGAAPSVLWPPNNKMRDVTISGIVADLVDPSPAFRVASVSCNEDATGDWAVTGILSLKLRAKRAGSGTGRVYTIHLEAADSTGNMRGASVTVVVPHNQ